MTDKIELLEVLDIEGNIKKHIIVRREDGSMLSYTKEYYDEMQAQAALSTPIVSSDAD